MGKYRCVTCEHTCEVNTGSAFDRPKTCIYDGHFGEWVSISEKDPEESMIKELNWIINQFKRGMNAEYCMTKLAGVIVDYGVDS